MRAIERRGLVTRPAPEVRPGEVLVALAWAGVCRTDLHAADGRIATPEGVILGHEGAGVVLESRADAFTAGTPVTLLPRIGCGGCQRGPLDCDEPARLGLDRDGVFAERIAVPATSVRAVPAGMDLRLAAYVEPVAAALAVLGGRDWMGVDALVQGRNRIAELTRRILVHAGAGVTLASADELAALDASRFDVVVETAPTGDALRQLVRLVRRRGRLVLKTRSLEPLPIDTGAIVEKELVLEGARWGSFEHAIHLLASGEIAVDDLLGEAFPLERHAEAFARARAETDKPFFRIAPA